MTRIPPFACVVVSVSVVVFADGCLDFALLGPLAPPADDDDALVVPPCDPWGARAAADWAVVQEPAPELVTARLGTRGNQLVVAEALAAGTGQVRAMCADAGTLVEEARASCPRAATGTIDSNHGGVVVVGAAGGACVVALPAGGGEGRCECFGAFEAADGPPSSAQFVSAQSFVVLEAADGDVALVERLLDGRERIRVGGLGVPVDSGIVRMSADDVADTWTVALLPPDNGALSTRPPVVVDSGGRVVAAVDDGVAWHATSADLAALDGTASLVGWSFFPGASGTPGPPPLHAALRGVLREDGSVTDVAEVAVRDGNPVDRGLAGVVRGDRAVLVGTDGFALRVEAGADRALTATHLPTPSSLPLRMGDLREINPSVVVGSSSLVQLSSGASPPAAFFVTRLDARATGLVAPVALRGGFQDTLLLPRGVQGAPVLVDNAGVVRETGLSLRSVERVGLALGGGDTGTLVVVSDLQVQRIAVTGLSTAAPVFAPPEDVVAVNMFRVLATVFSTQFANAGGALELWVLREGASGTFLDLDRCSLGAESRDDACERVASFDAGAFLTEAALVSGVTPSRTRLAVLGAARAWIVDGDTTALPATFTVQEPVEVPAPQLVVASPQPVTPLARAALAGECLVIVDPGNQRLVTVDLLARTTATTATTTRLFDVAVDLVRAGLVAVGASGRLQGAVLPAEGCVVDFVQSGPRFADRDLKGVVALDDAVLAVDDVGRVWQLGAP